MMYVTLSARKSTRLWWFMPLSMMVMMMMMMIPRVSSSSSGIPSTPLQKQHQQQQQQQIPVLYRYWGRRNNHSLTATAASSIPILIVGPNVDHWNLVGQELAALGYNIMACERVPQQQQQQQSSSSQPQDAETSWLWKRIKPGKNLQQLIQLQQQQKQAKNRDAAALYILQLLDALKWKQAVLVAVDSETAMAIAATLQLTTTTKQKRIAGLVLCGARLPSVQEFVQAYGTFSQQDETETSNHHDFNNRERETLSSLDQYLKEHMACPFTIVWDGSVPPLLVEHSSSSSSSSSEEKVSFGDESDVSAVPKTIAAARSLILGGGTAPHRRRPELFAWAVTRFVEEHINKYAYDNRGSKISWNDDDEQHQKEDDYDADADDDTGNNKFAITVHLDQVFSSGSLVVCGRLVATALFYTIVMKSLAFQYENIRWGVLNPIKAKYAWVRSLQKRAYNAMTGLAGRLWDGSIWRFVNKSRDEKEEEEKQSSLPSSENDADTTETLAREKAAAETEPNLESSSDEKDNDRSSDDKQKEDRAEEQNPSRPHKPIFFIDQVIA